MSNFRTILPVQKGVFSIDYQSPILCMGSCFTENIGQLFQNHKFSALLNPLGILYNPFSIRNGLNLLLSSKKYTHTDLVQHQDLWHSFDHHGIFSHPDQAVVLDKINTHLIQARTFLPKTKVLILTLGTANVFMHQATQKVVANCHKLPNTNFEKRRLTVEEIINELIPVLEEIKQRAPATNIIFTVSPVRHIRDGLIENQLSKATLLLAIEGLTQKLSYTHYFPAYELVVDDLRAYRFYEKDMVHPNASAIQYIWEYFQQTYFSDTTLVLLKKIGKIVQASQHRPFHINTKTHQQFVQKQLVKIQTLSQQYPFIDFTKEQKVFQAQVQKVVDKAEEN